ncbi:MAG: shikimate kinase [Actinomycetota bacterium]|nr:shikimate kinase [Actinomycetota bacterium]
MAPVAVIVGSPGAGKTSVGRRVAERLGVAFVDTDHVVEERAGQRIADIFVTEGEEAFRALEAQAVGDTLAASQGVVALGGGAVLRAETQEALAGCTVVWLKVGVPDAANRVGLNTARPLLLGNVRGTLSALLEQRNPVYERLATVVVDTSGKSLRQVTDEVIGAVRGE